MTNTQNTCREPDQNDYEILTGIKPRMSNEYRRKIFFPSMFRYVNSITEKGESAQFAFNELSKLTGYKLSYLKYTYYELLKSEMNKVETIDESINPLEDEPQN